MISVSRLASRAIVPSVVFCATPLLGSSPAARDIVDGLKDRERIMFAERQQFTVRYARSETRDVVATRSSGGLLRAKWVLGQRTGAWYVERTFLDPEKRQNVLIPAQPLVRIFKGNGVALDWDQHNSRVSIMPNESDNFNIFQGWHYFENSGLNPYRQILTSNGIDYRTAIEKSRGDRQLLIFKSPLLPDFLEDNISMYEVHSEAESVDGAPCLVVEWPGMDKIWVDVEHGFAIRRRRYNWSPAGPRAREVVNKDFREVQSGLWLPFRQEVDRYSHPEVEVQALWDKVASRSVYQVTQIDRSSAPAGLSSLALPIGTIVHDGIRRIEYRVSDPSGDPFAAPIGAAIDHLQRSKAGVFIFLAAAALLIAILALYFSFSKRRGHRSAILFILVSLITGYAAPASGVEDGARSRPPGVTDNGEWLWKPEWRERGDCGPNSLFVLMRLKGSKITLDAVKERVKFDEETGCTMTDLADAAEQFGMPMEARFVVPSELERIPFPYILHGVSGLKAKTGHFSVCVARDKQRGALGTIDPVHESFGWNPERGVVSEYSGYILVPKASLVERAVVPAAIVTVGILGIAILPIKRRRSPRAVDGGSGGHPQVTQHAARSRRAPVEFK